MCDAHKHVSGATQPIRLAHVVGQVHRLHQTSFPSLFLKRVDFILSFKSRNSILRDKNSISILFIS